MLKNVKIKRILKNTIFPLFTVVNRFIPKDDSVILLYSANMGIRHNLKPLKQYLVNNGYYKKYKIYCAVESNQYAEKDDCVTYINTKRAIFKFFRSAHVYYTTGQIPIKPSKDQIVIHLDHGTTSIKTGNLLTSINNGDDFYFTYYLVPSDIYIPVAMKEFLCKKENVLVNGEPVNDVLLTSDIRYNLGKFRKIGLWAPTFRQSDYLGYSDSNEELLPMFDQSEYELLNKILSELNIKLIVKLHPGQNLSGYSKLHYSNLDIYSDKEFNDNHFELYSLMRQMDFLLADYSSVFLEYLLLNRPIGFVIPDFEEYKSRRGFVFDNPLDFMPGEKIKTKDQLYMFFKSLVNDEDNYASERVTVCNLVHKYHDPNNCRRALEIGKITL